MNTKLTTEIASGFTIGRYRELRPHLDADGASSVEWTEVLGAFRRRMDERFFRPISLLLKAPAGKGAVSGFSILALDCLLIDSIQSFREGRVSTGEVSPAKSFAEFLKCPRFKDFNSADRSDFFGDVRNGLLHNGETRGNWLVRADQEKMLTKDAKPGSRIINRRIFHEAIAEEFEEYCCKLAPGSTSAPTSLSLTEMRAHFLQRMDAICGLAKGAPLLYFAYGSNLDEAQVLRRIPNAEPDDVAHLPGHRLTFTKHSTTWGGDAATIEPDAARMTWGFLYRVSNADRAALRKAEGGYELVKVEVLQSRKVGTTYRLSSREAFSFRAKESCNDQCGPTDAYLKVVLRGAESRQLPKDYIEDLSAVAASSVKRRGCGG